MLGCFCQWAKVEIKASDIVSLPGKFQLLSYSWTWNTDQILREISPNKYILWATQYNLSNLADKLYCVAAVHGPGIIQTIYNSSETNNGQSLHGSLPQNATARVLHKSSIWIIYSLHCVCVLLLIGYNIHSPAPTTCSHVCVCVTHTMHTSRWKKNYEWLCYKIYGPRQPRHFCGAHEKLFALQQTKSLSKRKFFGTNDSVVESLDKLIHKLQISHCWTTKPLPTYNIFAVVLCCVCVGVVWPNVTSSASQQ